MNVGMLAWLGVVVAGLMWGTPLVGNWDWHPGAALLPAVAVGGAVVVRGPSLARSLPWRFVPLVTAATATLWATLLAVGDGWDRLTAPLTTKWEYEPFAAGIDEPLSFVRSFTGRLPELPIHVKGHPPGATLTFWGLDRIGLGGAGWAAALVLGAWGVAAGAVVLAAADVAGEMLARRAAPFVAVVPAAVWASTSADALFAGVGAAGIALLVSATTGARRDGRAVAGGLVLGATLLLSYGAVLLATVPAAVAVARRAWRPLVIAGAAAGAVLVAAGAAGFWWHDGLLATREVYEAGVASRRSAAYFALAGNPAALALAVGPAVAAGLAQRLWVLPAAALVAVALADLSLLSKGEVERIWLPFVPWLAVGAAAVRPTRPFLAAQVALGLGLQAVLVSPW